MSEHYEGKVSVEPGKDWSVIAQQLDELQKKENNGRGVSCVRSIISSLQRGDIVAARAEFQLDTDKILNYPELHTFLQKALSE